MRRAGGEIITTLWTGIRHLRLFESIQILVPGMLGILSQYSFPSLRVFLLYTVTYGCHVLSVYSYNDYCDFRSDSLNPRKAAEAFKNRALLRIQTWILMVIFLAGVVFLPATVIVLLAANQILCMAYSDPRARLKGKLLGSEIIHFFAGFSYFTTGVLVAGGAVAHNLIGAVLFGLLYLSGGTFNEIMDCDADREAGLRHLAVVAGKRRALAFVIAVHYVGFALLAIYETSIPVIVCCVAGVLLYTMFIGALAGKGDSPAMLLRFRRRYRLIFGALLVVLALVRATGLTQGEISGPAGREETGHAVASSD
jgi:4-hydroxybenzoate polyprenyltransferase